VRTLVYKRTHHGDPGPAGCFGVHDCMGRVRSWDFEAVIGVGGVGDEPTQHGLTDRINWIGIGPRKRSGRGRRGPLVTFDHYRFYGSDGPRFSKLAPVLADRMYSRNVRALLRDVNDRERSEIMRILALARGAPPSRARSRTTAKQAGCSPALQPAVSETNDDCKGRHRTATREPWR
jgi:hypothetical protein